MKILHLISGGDTGGAKTHVLSLIKGLSNHVEVKLVCFIKDQFYMEGKELGIDIEVIEQEKRYDLSIIKKLEDKIKDENFDIIHCHGARANFIGMLLKRRVKKCFVTTVHSDYKLDFNDNIYKKFVYTPLNAIALKFFDYYIAISSNFKNMLIERGFDKEKIFTVYNGIDFNRPINITPKEEFLNKYDIDCKGKKIIGIMGRLDLVKNHETFIEAAGKLSEKRDDVIYLIAGEGPEKEKLISMTESLNIKDKVYFLGFVDEPYSFFNAIDINVLTSKSESFPYVILEGARLKKTVVSTNVGGIGDLIENDVNGYLFQVGNVDELVKYIEKILNDKNKMDKMGQRLHDIVKEKFSLERMALDHYKIYRKIVENRRYY
ncbi:glycosyltransferase family 4 protein [Thermohalobacter berrensis]|uniref:Glycosyl transferase family 1 n=1 Tax=Thermohalobacter berrensis TaxID=99594 RepID=A0A419SXW6_9FIRM|nr:glycosyltransferase family 4 protein [Thermohalobacter berrensis]RKD30074.1 glycosyl transferase family 1 [Thermohalobacter berrensis]